MQAYVYHSLIIPFSINCSNSNIHLFVGQKYEQEMKYKIITMWCSCFFLNPCFYFFQWCSHSNRSCSCRGTTGGWIGTLPQQHCISPEGMLLQQWKDWWWRKESLWCLILSMFTCEEIDSTEPPKKHCLVSMQGCHYSFCPLSEKDSVVLHWTLLETVGKWYCLILKKKKI